MKPIIKSIIEYSQSVYSTSIAAKEVEKAVTNLLAQKKYSCIIDSEMPLYITLVFNTRDEKFLDLLGRESIYVKVDEDLEGDHDIYNLQISLLRLQLPNDFDNCVILVGSKEYNQNADIPQKDKDLPTFIAEVPNRTFDNIILPEDVKSRLMRAISIIENRDIIFEQLQFKKVDPATKTIICFYGPAGTGKTITAHAIASYLGKKIMVSSYAQIESKYVGDGAKNLRNIFKAAEEQDAVLFMDEADSFLSKRIESTSNGSDKHYNRMSNEMFQLLENFNGCVIFATNLHSDVDNAFKSRIVDSIMFPLPDVKGREAMLKTMVPSFILDSVFKQNSDELSIFCESLNGFSGRDIRKSLLLTYAEIAPQIKALGLSNINWNKEIFSVGFNSVRETVELAEDIPTDLVENLLDEKKFKNKQFEIAKLAVLVDGPNIDDREQTLINDLSQTLKGVPADGECLSNTEPLETVCTGLTEEQKRVIIDTAIRVVTIDGDFSENEHAFIRKVSNLLGYSKLFEDSIISYGESMALSYLQWIKSLDLK